MCDLPHGRLLRWRSQKTPYRHSDVDMPILLTVGSIRTPEFSVVSEWYDIMVQERSYSRSLKCSA